MAKAKLYIDGLPSDVPVYTTGVKSWFVAVLTDLIPADQGIDSIKESGVKLCVVYSGVCWLVGNLYQSDPTLIRFVCVRDDSHSEVQRVLLTEMILN